MAVAPLLCRRHGGVLFVHARQNQNIVEEVSKKKRTYQKLGFDPPHFLILERNLRNLTINRILPQPSHTRPIFEIFEQFICEYRSSLFLSVYGLYEVAEEDVGEGECWDFLYCC